MVHQSLIRRDHVAVYGVRKHMTQPRDELHLSAPRLRVHVSEPPWSLEALLVLVPARHQIVISPCSSRMSCRINKCVVGPVKEKSCKVVDPLLGLLQNVLTVIGATSQQWAGMF